jgi:hypothetical protein
MSEPSKELEKYAITAWISDGDGKQHTEQVVQLKIAESVLEQAVLDGRIDELNYIKSQNVAIPCEPDCDEVRHARHEGAWEQHLEFDRDIDERIDELRGRGVSPPKERTSNE